MRARIEGAARSGTGTNHQQKRPNKSGSSDARNPRTLRDIRSWHPGENVGSPGEGVLAERSDQRGGSVATQRDGKAEVVAARDGVEAMDYLFCTGTYAGHEITVMPQVVLLDLKLPKVNGLEVLRKIRADERTTRLPIVVFTSSSEEEDMVKSYDLGANSYVRKPVDFDQFLEATKQLGLYWLVLNEAAPIG